MDPSTPLPRRHLLGGLAGTVVGALAGCTGDGDDPANGDDPADDPNADTDEGDNPDDDSGDTPDPGGDTADAGDDDSGDGSSDDGSDGSSDDGSDGSSDDGSGDDNDGERGDGSPDVPEAADLDLREANVVGVAFDGGDGSYDFDVTLHHDDDGEDGYANWWQVERLDGSRLGRRDLLHAHSRQPFTRSETIDGPGEVTCVVVRGHDQTHGYGGVAMLVNLDSGAMRAVDQGTERQSFDEGDCP